MKADSRYPWAACTSSRSNPARSAICVARTYSGDDPVHVLARHGSGDGLRAGEYGTPRGRCTGQPPSVRGSSSPSQRIFGSSPSAPHVRAGARCAPGSSRGRSRRSAATPARDSGSYMPAHPGLIRPSAATLVISVKTSPAPPSASDPRCTRWKSFGVPVDRAVHAHGRDRDAVVELELPKTERQ